MQLSFLLATQYYFWGSFQDLIQQWVVCTLSQGLPAILEVARGVKGTMSDTGTALKARETPGALTHLCFAAAQVAGFPGINRCAVQKTALHQSPTIPFGFIFFF